MKKVVRILLAILMVATLALGISACKSDCDKGNHDMQLVSTDNATCTAAKVEHYKCANCDHTEDKTVGNPLGHDYTNVNWTPSATDNDKHERKCTRCDHVDSALHTTGDDTCPECGKTLTETPPHQHDYAGQPWQIDAANNKHYQVCKDTTCTVRNEHTATMSEYAVSGGKHEHHCTVSGCTVADSHNPALGEWTVDGSNHVRTCTVSGCSLHEEHAASMSEFAANGSKHESHCTATGCTVNSEHNADMGAWKPCQDDGTKHERECAHDGCGYVEKAVHGSITVPGTPATCTEDGRRNGTKCPDCNKVLTEGEVIPKKGHKFSTEWTHDQENGKHYYACTNEGCTARDSETLCNYEYGVSNTNATQHWGVCSVCNNQSKPVDHNSDKVLEAVEVKCYQDGLTEGKACSVCDRVIEAQQKITDRPKHSWVWVYGDDRDDDHKNVDHYQTCSVVECNAVTNAGDHALQMTQGNDAQHWKACLCGYVDENSKEEHNWDVDGFECPGCHKVHSDVYLAVKIDGEDEIHRLGEQGTLQQAVDLVGEGKTATIYLGRDLSGSGVKVPSGRNITFRFNNHTYTVTNNLVGSTDTETNGFQLLKGSNVTMINGTIKVTDSKAYIVIQNYCNLTLDNVNLDASASTATYALSNNCGNTLIKNGSKITAAAGKVAFDAYYNLLGAYPEGVSVTVEQGCLITGIIEYGADKANVTDDWQTKTVISLPNADKNYNIKLAQGLDITCESASITIQGTHLAHREGAGVVTTPATCHSKGVTSYSCTVCGKVIRTEEIEMTAHAYDAGVVTTPATCTTDGVKTYTCTNEGCGQTKTEAITALDHDWQTKWSFDENNTTVHEHWHACNRCDQRKDEGPCSPVTIIEAQKVTCTENGRTAGIECEICKKTIQKSTVIEAQGHKNGTEYVVTDIGHQIKCSVCGEVTSDPIAHKYVDSVCECGREITIAEIKALYDAGVKNTNGTFKLEGKVKSIDIAYDSGFKNISLTLIVTDNGKTYEFYCFRIGDANGIVGSDIKVDDIIAFNNCSVDIYKGTKELVNGKFTKHQIATYSITHNDVDGLTVNGLPSSAQRGEKVEFTVEYDKDKYVLTVKVGIEEITAVNGTYSFDVNGDVTVEFSMLDNTVTHPHTNSNSLEVKSSAGSLGITGSYSNTEATKTLTFNGTEITFGWTNLYNQSGEIQLNGSKNNGISALYSKTSIPNLKTIELRFSSSSGGGTLLVIAAKDAAFTEIETLTAQTLSNGDSLYVVPQGYTYFKISETAGSAKRISTLVISTEIECSNTENFTEVDLAEEFGITDACACENHAVFYKCSECGAYFSDELKNVKVSAEYIKANYTMHDKATVWTHGTVDGKLSHWHACANCDVKLDLAECVGELKADTAKAATCTEAGKAADKVCNVCGQTVETGAVIPALDHDYEYTAKDGGKHGVTCKREGCDITFEDATCEAAANAQWQMDGTNHWKLCVCGNEVGKTAHTGDTCECSALKLSVAVVDEDEQPITAHDVHATFPAYAKVGDAIEVTVTSQRFEIIMVSSGDTELALREGTNTYEGTVANAVITVYASELTSAKYTGVTVTGNAGSDVSVSVNLGDAAEELAANTVLAEGNVIKITVMYFPDDVDVKVTVTQGSTSVDVALGEYDADEMSATATYTCAALGDVTINVTASKRATITISGENATVTVTQNDESVVGKTVSVGSKVNITIAANDGYVVDSKVITGATGPEGNADGEYTVTGDLTIMVTVAKLVTVNIPAVTGATVAVKTDKDVTVADGTAVAAGTKLIISVTLADAVTTQVISVKIGEDSLTANTDGDYEYTVSKDITANAITVNVEIGPKENKSWKLATADNLVDGAKVVIVAGDKIATGTSFSTKFSTATFDSSALGTEDSPFNISTAMICTLNKVGDNWSLKLGEKYLSYSSGTNFTTATVNTGKAAQWTITANGNQVKMLNANSTSRGVVYRGGTTNAFGAYATSNITSGGEYSYAGLYIWC